MKACPLHHIHHYCTNLEETIAFWRDGFGVPFVRYRKFGEDSGAEMDMGNGVLFFAVQCCSESRALSKPICGLDHLGMQVPDIDAALKHLTSIPGVRVGREPFMSESLRCAFVIGPDEVRVELIETPR